MEGKNPEGKILTELEGTAATIANTSIKLETTNKGNYYENKVEHHETTGCATEKRLPYVDKEAKEDETGGKTAQIRQETQAEEAAAQYDKTCRKNDQKKIIIATGYLKWCYQEKSKINKNQSCRKRTNIVTL